MSDSGLFTHDALVIRAEKWLKSVGCGFTLREFRAVTQHGEQPDAIGWTNMASILIECKTNRKDFLADKKKVFRQYPDMGMGGWRFYLCPPGVIHVEDLPPNWGLLWATPKTIRRIHGAPKGNNWSDIPFDYFVYAEMAVLYSALRRLTLRGHLSEVYQTPKGTA